MQAAIEEEQRNKSAIVRELWIRGIIPPSLQGACYTDNSFACDFVSRYNNLFPTWSGYLQYIGIGFISAVVCGVLVWAGYSTEVIQYLGKAPGALAS
jgi:hypothetical protein